MGVTLEQARVIAERFLAQFSTSERPLALYPEPDDEGWSFVFEWNTKRYYRTRDTSDSVGPGSGPIVVVKSSRDVWMLASAPSFDVQLAEYAERNNIRSQGEQARS
ncbi:YrhB domain-containing protein [Nocardia sp. NPDC052566]|uniref:YrhB domain-containing protein n=1 Tax=Nocardia sp. NPDC052566 TaxID=3364330 RepID=UPI0037CC6F27